jgi:hypothetical protein
MQVAAKNDFQNTTPLCAVRKVLCLSVILLQLYQPAMINHPWFSISILPFKMKGRSHFSLQIKLQNIR